MEKVPESEKRRESDKQKVKLILEAFKKIFLPEKSKAAPDAVADRPWHLWNE